MEHLGWVSLIPPILALTLVIVTRKVFISLGIAILVGAFIAFDQIEQAFAGIFQTIIGLFISFDALDEPTFSGVFQSISDAGFALNDWELYIILFLILLGIIASLITFSGGGEAFSRWAGNRIKTRKGALFLPFFLGLVIFIDDYFNALTVGNTSRPLTDRYRVSRAKLAYIVDSTSAPICVIMPLSSWGAYIIGIMASIFAANQIVAYSPFEAFIYTVPMNFYALIALLFLVLIILFNIDIGLMKKHEDRAKEHNQLTDPEKGDVAGSLDEKLLMKNGRIYQLFAPLLVLVISTVALLLYTGAQGATSEGLPVTILNMMEYTDIGLSLVIGSAIGLIVSLIVTLTAKPIMGDFGKAIKAGVKSMLPAIGILILAWTTIDMIGRLGTGNFLASLIDQSIHPGFLPVMIFLIAAFSGLATGTSWGTFGMLLPISAQIAVTVEPTMLIPMFAAVLAGSIFGDHISPISDTTILSAAGSGSHHMDHVITQLPYALITAVISTIGFLILGFLGAITAWIVVILLLAIVVVVLQSINRKTATSSN
ncbi:tetracycline resistance efflux pump [Alkalihalobacillus xiaoxiensis]|uniref:Tetracycline resistance efflux pump n=1 Tax=Shouchella xiaoxiensis TaxID=766895 RepID=A0ABS2SYD7_9BACI|nr:Na+/H+ antiporter NhaC family protein [Shouchella xiaoxiensis]MBM7840543.1 tetracycline resistance efflux pump [Shouchella xiaoxiensis]